MAGLPNMFLFGQEMLAAERTPASKSVSEQTTSQTSQHTHRRMLEGEAGDIEALEEAVLPLDPVTACDLDSDPAELIGGIVGARLPQLWVERREAEGFGVVEWLLETLVRLVACTQLSARV